MSIIVFLLGCAPTSGGGSADAPAVSTRLDSASPLESAATLFDTTMLSVPTGDTAPVVTGDTAALVSTGDTLSLIHISEPTRPY